MKQNVVLKINNKESNKYEYILISRAGESVQSSRGSEYQTISGKVNVFFLLFSEQELKCITTRKE